MGKIIIPSRDKNKDSESRSVNEIVVFDSKGNFKSRKTFRGTMVLQKRHFGKRVLEVTLERFQKHRPFWQVAVFLIFFGVWICEMSHLFR